MKVGDKIRIEPEGFMDELYFEITSHEFDGRIEHQKPRKITSLIKIDDGDECGVSYVLSLEGLKRTTPDEIPCEIVETLKRLGINRTKYEDDFLVYESDIEKVGE